MSDYDRWRADKAEAAVERVERLADEYEARAFNLGTRGGRTLRKAARELRAALAGEKP